MAEVVCRISEGLGADFESREERLERKERRRGKGKGKKRKV